MDGPSNCIKPLEPGFLQPADCATAPDQEQASAVAADNAAPPREAEIITLDFSQVPTDREYWISRLSVLFDRREQELVDRLFDLNRDVGISLDMANVSDCPKVAAANLRNTVTALKSAFVIIGALDKHRHGNIQKITIEYGDNTSLTLKTPVRDPRFAQSDEIIDDLFFAHVMNFSGFESRCREKADKLCRTPVKELRAIRYGQGVSPDRRTWETKFRGLASWLSGQAVKFSRTLETRHIRGQQHILVDRIGNVPLGKLGTKAVLPPHGADMPHEVCKPAEPTPVVSFVEKAGEEADRAAA